MRVVSPPHFVYDFSRKMFFRLYSIEGALSGLRKLLETGNPLKIMKYASYLTSKALSVLKTFCLDFLVM